jgi:succinate dehydrogenase / fumarate reductase, cytochrome b subunit
MSTRARPLSPHLQIYRWQIGNTLSILHRAAGVLLGFGLIAVCYWLASLAGGEAAYARAARILTHPLSLIVLCGWFLAFYYHLLNGVRHLFWDMGKGFGKRESHMSGWAAVFGSIVLTVLTIWQAAHFLHGVHP